MSLKRSVRRERPSTWCDGVLRAAVVAGCLHYGLCGPRPWVRAQDKQRPVKVERLAPSDLERLNRVRQLLQSAQGKMTFRSDPVGAKADLGRAARLLRKIAASADTGMAHPDIKPVAARLGKLRRQLAREHTGTARASKAKSLSPAQESLLRRARSLLQRAYSKMQLRRDYVGARKDVDQAVGLVEKVMTAAGLPPHDARVAELLQRIAVYRKDLQAKLGPPATRPKEPRPADLEQDPRVVQARQHLRDAYLALVFQRDHDKARRAIRQAQAVLDGLVKKAKVRRDHPVLARHYAELRKYKAELAKGRAKPTTQPKAKAPSPRRKPTLARGAKRPARATTRPTKGRRPARPQATPRKARPARPRSLARVKKGQWVRYRVTDGALEQKQTVLAVGTDAVVVRMEAIMNGQVINTMDQKIALKRAGKPILYMVRGKRIRTETLIVAGQKLTCEVSEVVRGARGKTRIWTSRQVPLLGLVRSVIIQDGREQVEMQLTAFSQE